MVDLSNREQIRRFGTSVCRRVAKWPVWQRRALIGKTAWVIMPFIGSQAIRLVSSIVLAWLLAPQLLGLMLLINTLRTGGELLTDVGVGQSIVSNQIGGEPRFYNTAWTMQIIRGFVLFAVAIALTAPIADAYNNPQLLTLLPVMATIFLITGLTSPARFLLQKRMEVRKLALFDLGTAIFGTIVQIILAWLMPTIWALILGSLIATAGSASASYLLMDWRTLNLSLDNKHLRSIIHFGKWVFVSSIVYFLAMNFDRLYFAGAIPLGLLGLYGIARTFADMTALLFMRLGQLLIFPKISAVTERGEELRRQILPLRMALLAVVAICLSLAMALSDQLIIHLYDARYHAAGIIMAVLFIGTWFGVLASMAEGIMMGLGRPAGVAFGNGAKLIAIGAGLPLALAMYGLIGALAVLVLAEGVRYAVLALSKRRVGLGFVRQDLAMTMVFVLLAFIFRELTMVLGWTEGFTGWVVQLERLNG